MRKALLLISLLGLLAACGEQQVDAPIAPTTVPLNQAAGSSTTPVATATTSIVPSPEPTTSAGKPARNAPTAVVEPTNAVTLPDGFGISVFQSKLAGPRMLAIGPDGAIYTAERGEDRIVRLPDRNADGLADGVEVIADGFDSPSSMIFDQAGNLYVAETTKVIKLTQPDPEGKYTQRQTIIDGLPAGGHSTRTLLFSPDESKLYVAVGSSCNVCNEDDERRATVMEYDPDGSNGRIYAKGLRNAVGITWRPGTNELWATNNGRDMLGDDQPPETVNVATSAGLDFGWPRCHSGRIADPEFGKDANACQGVTPPAVEMQAHSAPLGLAFGNGSNFPEPYQSGLFVAFHGSWNRSSPTGYKVVFVPVTDGKAGNAQDFATGWLTDAGAVWGRPVDVIVGRDGSLYLSDDAGGAIYRVFAK
ncbi:MAG: PQQ-dependent sugar dehydrogenase [Chloroflexi bacterium]|nr:PQQ-dependent sugar dehydrogenase [Chloroflexota bacterium]